MLRCACLCAGDFEAALELTREALAEGVVSLREVGELHGDILMAIIDRDQEAGTDAYAAAVAAYSAALSAAGESDAASGIATTPPTTLFFKLGRAQSGAHLLDAAHASYKSAMNADRENKLGVKAEALVALAVDALNSGRIDEGKACNKQHIGGMLKLHLVSVLD
jgi:tetratricopeptide (TPR) repeat protein